MKHIFLVGMLVFSGFVLACLDVSDPDVVIQDAKKIGEKNYLMHLVDDPEKWIYVLYKIESGNNAWLTVAEMLRSVSDAATTQALVYSMSFALKNAPENVLARLDKHYSVKAVCGSPFIEEDMHYELGFLKTIRHKVKQAKFKGENQARCLNHITQQIAAISVSDP